MAFNVNNLNKITSGDNTAAVRMNCYTDTSSNIATLTAPGFFNDWVYARVNDVIYITGNNGQGFYQITAVDPNVTVAPVNDPADLSLSEGAIPVGNSSGVAAELAIGAANTVPVSNGTTLAYGLIDTDNLADDAVTTAKILDANVSTAKLADNAVTTVKIADANVTLAKLATEARTHIEQYVKDNTDTNAVDATAETPIFKFNQAAVITELSYTPRGALFASDTIYATIIISKRDADGSNKTTIASLTTRTSGSGGSGDWTAFAEVPFTISSGSLSANQHVTFEITKTGGGRAIPAGVLGITYTI